MGSLLVSGNRGSGFGALDGLLGSTGSSFFFSGKRGFQFWKVVGRRGIGLWVLGFGSYGSKFWGPRGTRPQLRAADS